MQEIAPKCNLDLEVNLSSEIEKQAVECEASGICNRCKALKFLPDPDPEDWFRDTDVKAFCSDANKKILGSLMYNETGNISRPDWCPRK